MALFALQGFVRGLVAQTLGALGLLLGILAAVLTSRWVGAHWSGAQPAVVFWVLRGLVALLAGLAVATLFNVVGARGSAALRKISMGWLDRSGGIAAGVLVGLSVGCLVLLGSLRGPIPDWISRPAASARLTLPILKGGVAACTLGRNLPGSEGLRRQLLEATHRVGRSSSSPL